MTQTLQAEYVGEYEDHFLAETPFGDARSYETYEDRAQESESYGEAAATPSRFETPFEIGESLESGSEVNAAPEIAALAEMTAELNDHVFRESLEELANEALELHGDRFAAEYGDHEMRDAAAGRLLVDHFAPLSAQAEALLDGFFERLEGYEAEALTDTEIERMVGEMSPTSMLSPASEQFLGGLLRKAGKLVSGAVKLAKSGVQGALSLAGKGLAAVGKLALGPLLKGLKALAMFLLRHVVKFALNQLPPALAPLAHKLSDRLFRALGETSESEAEDHEQTEGEAISAGADIARLEAEFDVMAAQLLFTPEEMEIEHLVASYGESESIDRSLSELDDTRTNLARELQRLETNETAQPVMEQFLPALLWPAAKTAITILGRKKLVSFLGGLLAKLVKPMIGSDASGLLAPAIADAGLRIFGLEAEAGQSNARAVTAEALSATIEETVNRIGELPQSAFENETVLESAVREAFEDAASTYFPSAHIKSELRQTVDRRGMFTRLPHGTGGKRYAKYSEPVEVTITPRVAGTVRTFDGAMLRDHLRDRMDVAADAPLKTNVRIYQVLPGTTTAAIARAEGVQARDLHPLTQQAAGALCGPNAAALGPRDAVSAMAPIDSRHALRLRQRLYYIEPPAGRRHQLGGHAHRTRTEALINLRRGEIRVWLYISEPLCQRIALELNKAGNTAAAYRLVLPLVKRVAEKIRTAGHRRTLPHSLHVVSDVPNLDHHVPVWLTVAGPHLGSKIGEWAGHHVALYLRNHAEQFRRTSGSAKDGLTLRITMTRIPGLEALRLAATNGHYRHTLHGTAWLRGEPAFEVVALPGYAIR